MTRERTISPGLTVLLSVTTLTVFATAGLSQTLSFKPIGSIIGPAAMIRVQGGYAYVAADKTLTVVDISNPEAAKPLGAYTFPLKIWGFRVAGSLVYVAADFFEFGILDVSNAAVPMLRGSLKTRGQAKNVAVFGTKVLVADHMTGLDLIDVSNLAKPVSLDSFFLEGYARDVAISGSLAYAVDSPTGFYVLDLLRPGTLEAVSTLQSARHDAPFSSSLNVRIGIRCCRGAIKRQIAP
jgi:hypothetical protein